MLKVLLLSVLLALPLSASATTYYVDNCVTVGNDSNNGTSTATAWLTVGYVNAHTFNPGDSVLFQRTCTWREELIPLSSGSSGNPITFGNFGSGALPILDGTNVVPSGGWSVFSGNIYSQAVAYLPNMVFQDGNNLLTYKISTGAMVAGSYYYNAGTLYVEISDNSNPASHIVEASRYPTSISNGGPGLITIAGLNYVTVSGLAINRSNNYGVSIQGGDHITVQNNTFNYDFQNNVEQVPVQPCSTVCGPNGSNINILSNTATNVGAARTRAGSIEAVCISIAGAQTALIDSNYCSLIPATTGLQEGGGATNVTFSRNYVIGGFNAIYISNGYWNGGDTLNTTIKYNIGVDNGHTQYMYQIGTENVGNINGVDFFGNVAVGQFAQSSSCSSGLQDGYPATPGAIENIHVYNNTFYNCYVGIDALGPRINATNVYENNLIYSPPGGIPLEMQDTVHPEYYLMDYNLVYAPGQPNPILWGTISYSVAGIISAFGIMTHSVQADPLFVNAASNNLVPSSGSPALNAGSTLASTYIFDLDPISTWPMGISLRSQATQSAWTIGAYVGTGGAISGNAPTINSVNSFTFAASRANTFTVTATGMTPITFSESGSLPNGVTFNTSTGVLSGTPAVTTNGSYPIVITASNGVSPNATQTFTLSVNTTAPPTNLNIFIK